MRRKATDHIHELSKYATEINITIPNTILNSHILGITEFQPLKSSLNALQNNTLLNVTVTQLPDDLTSINITLNTEE